MVSVAVEAAACQGSHAVDRMQIAEGVCADVTNKNYLDGFSTGGAEESSG